MVNGRPTVSVLLPCYNYRDWVAEAITSVLDQQIDSLELIVINDGSTDDSLAVIQQTIRGRVLPERIVGIEVINQDNAGVSAALNAGLQLARGRYVATFDADDRMSPGRLELMVAHLEQHPEVVCVGGQTQKMLSDGQLKPLKKKRHAVRRYNFDHVISEAFVVGGNVAMFNREHALRLGGYDPDIRVQDFQMTLRLVADGGYIDMLPEVVTFYRQHPRSLSHRARHEYEFGLMALAPYQDHPAYAAGCAQLTLRAMRSAIESDRRFAWMLARSIPPRYWSRQYFRRLRHLLRSGLSSIGRSHGS